MVPTTHYYQNPLHMYVPEYHRSTIQYTWYIANNNTKLNCMKVVKYNP